MKSNEARLFEAMLSIILLLALVSALGIAAATVWHEDGAKLAGLLLCMGLGASFALYSDMRSRLL